MCNLNSLKNLVEKVNKKMKLRINRFFIKLFLNLFVFQAYSFYDNISHEAFVNVPVANIATKSLSYLAKEVSLEELYNNFANSPETGPDSCARVHQLLFNEKINIINQKDQEVEFEIPNVFYLDPSNNKVNKFWTLKKYIILLKKLSDEQSELIPDILADFSKSKIFFYDNILTLILPWQDDITKRSYSIGTRLVRVKNLDNEEQYAVKILDQNLFPVISYIPKKLCLRYFPKDKNESKKLFISILKKWAQLNIPYVWGGGSCIKKYQETKFILNSQKQNDAQITNWIRPEEEKPYTGFDCSGLVLKAAQISYLPYFYKNTVTLAANLKKLDYDDVIQDGDLIWHKGHVMIVSDVQNNLLIEAVGYSSGYGQVHEISLDKVFLSINNYNDLLEVYKNKLTLKRLNVRNEISNQITEFYIYRI